MFLKHKRTGDLLEVLSLEPLYDPCQDKIMAQSHAGQEMQDPETFFKADLLFPSGEVLPQCWINAHYQEDRVKQMAMLVG